MKPLYLMANWKSNKTIDEAMTWFSAIESHMAKRTLPDQVKIILCVPFTVSAILQEKIKKSNLPISLGVQNVSAFPSGAYTGEISAEMLKGLAEFVLIGHSERRRYFHETDEELFQKAKAAAASGLKTIYCVDAASVPIPDMPAMILYEPQSAIGSGNAEDPVVANSVCKQLLEKNQSIPVLYGGSVTEKTLKGFLTQPEISGVGVGGASLDPEKFLQMVDVMSSLCTDHQ